MRLPVKAAPYHFVDVLNDVFAHVVADGIGIPDGSAQQTSHDAPAGLPGSDVAIVP